MIPRAIHSTVLCLALAAGCAVQPLSAIVYPRTLYPASHYPLSAEASGVRVAAVPFAVGRDVYADPAAAPSPRVGIALNVLDAGVLPIRLVVWNDSGEPIVLDPDQITGVAGGVSYRPYSPEDAVTLVTRSEAFKAAIKGSKVGPVLQSLLGGELLAEALRGGVSGVCGRLVA